MTLIKAAIAVASVATIFAATPALAARKKYRPVAADHFTWYCVQCHGPRGDGKGVNNRRAAKLPVSPRNLTDGKDMAQFSDGDMFRTITRGGEASDLSPIMPPWGNVLSEDEIRALVAHVRKLCKCKFDPKIKERAMRKAGKLPEEDPKPAAPGEKPSSLKKGTGS